MATLQGSRRAVVAPVEVSAIRVLSRADLKVLSIARPINQLQNLRDTHHRIARAVASGLSNGEVAATCGISNNRVSVLRADPAFAELVAHYRAILTAEWAEAADPVADYLRQNALKAQAMLSDKLDHASEQGEFLPTRDLLGIAELGLDRTGYGKVNKNVNINVDFAAKLEQARRRSDELRSVRTIEAPPTQPQSVPGESPLPPSRSVPSSIAATFRRL
jgi:DNA-binding CsgD family transcriptional regulator